MPLPSRFRFRLILALAPLTIFARANAAGATVYGNSDNPDPHDSEEGVYPVAYHRPTAKEITGQLERVRGYLETAFPARIIDRRTGQPISPQSAPIREAVADRGPQQKFNPLDYTTGVIHAGMLAAAEATGDRRFADFTGRQLQFIADALPYFRAQAAQFGPAGNSFRGILAPAALDDCGAMTAALVRARLAHVGPDLQPIIAAWGDYIAHRQFRLPDGTLARQRPQPVSLWADDFYMGVVPLAQLGRLTGESRWFDDAARTTVQMAQRLYRPDLGLFAHGWSENSPGVPDFYWGRANGWAMVTLCDLLDILPADHPRRPELLQLLRGEIRGVAQRQSGEGRWHQLLDRDDSFLETSASAMFVYGIAHAVNQGWIRPETYGSIAQAGWIGVAAQINAAGQVEQTCVATTYAGDPVYYYHRPVSVYAGHGYGPVLLAGAEMIQLLRNPAFTISYKNRTYYYTPSTHP
jgi:unsaturated rhamnogalacturonyl hydrolase